jgi:hypothetical protein
MVALFFTSLPFHLPPIKYFVREQGKPPVLKYRPPSLTMSSASIPDLFTHFEDKHKPINIPNI